MLVHYVKQKDLIAAGKGKVTVSVSLVQMTAQSIASERWNYPTNQLNADTNRFEDVIMSNKRAEEELFYACRPSCRLLVWFQVNVSRL